MQMNYKSLLSYGFPFQQHLFQKQPYFSVISKFADENSHKDFVDTIERVLRKVVSEGIDKDTLNLHQASSVIRALRKGYGIVPYVKQIDTLAGEFPFVAGGEARAAASAESAALHNVDDVGRSPVEQTVRKG